jgi:predicted Mrr-cat superfamily restriction endonuclease
MGYQTRVSVRGPDRGVDLLASPDGLGLLADLVVANYERFDIEGQRLMPLMKVYWPAE